MRQGLAEDTPRREAAGNNDRMTPTPSRDVLPSHPQQQNTQADDTLQNNPSVILRHNQSLLQDVITQLQESCWEDFFSQPMHPFNNLRNWVCTKPNCGVYNLASSNYCSECHRSRTANNSTREYAELLKRFHLIQQQLQERGIDCLEDPPFMQQLSQMVACFESDCQRLQQASNNGNDWQEPSQPIYTPPSIRQVWQNLGTPEELWSAIYASMAQMDPEAFLELQALLLGSYDTPPEKAIEIPEAWLCADPPDEMCYICCDEEAYKTHGACQCPRCHKHLCQACLKSIGEQSQKQEEYRYSEDVWNRTVYSTKYECPFCRKDVSAESTEED